MQAMLIIGAGGFIGSVSRYLLSHLIQDRFFSSFPFGTLSVNIVGCFLIGLVFGLSERSNLSSEWRLFLATGIIGGFTTFSAFSLETVSLLRDAQYFHALGYVAMSVLLGVAATFFGILVLKLF
jgi:CrcB protein